MITLSSPTLEAGPSLTASKVDVSQACARMIRQQVRLLTRIAVYGKGVMAQAMKVDTGWARGQLSFDVAQDGSEARFGILSPVRYEGSGNDAPTLAEILNWQEHGIRRHFVSFTNKDGSLRYGLIKWAERHGFKIYSTRTAVSKSKEEQVSAKMRRFFKRFSAAQAYGLARKGMWVWGYRHPWMSTARHMVAARFPQLLGEEEGKL